MLIKYSSIFFLLCLFSFHPKAQNLFANSGFEDLNNCTEHHVDCAPAAWFNIPATNILVNSRIAPKPLLGNMVLTLPIGNVLANFNKPRFVYTAFCCPLVRGEKYTLSFFINTAGIKFQGLCFYFTNKEPALYNVNSMIEKASINITEESIDAEMKQGWKHIRYIYTATGNERFCIVTNAGLPAVEYEMKNAMNGSGDVLCFIDEMIFASQNKTIACAEYAENIKKLYDQHYRHSDNVLAFPPPPETKPIIKVRTDTIIIPSLLFDKGKSVIKPAVIELLDKFIDTIKNKNFFKIEISGYTDNSGEEKMNQALSENRAAAIKEYIINKLPQFKEKIFSFGKGQNFAGAKNDTEKDKQKNRKVEIVVTYLNLIK